MTFISIVPYNRELLVINDMEVFTSFFCYARKQKKGLVPFNKPVPETESEDGDTELLFDDAEERKGDEVLPITNLGFRS